MQNVDVEIDEFWMLAEDARANVEASDHLPTGEAVGAALVDRLAALPPPRILGVLNTYAARGEPPTTGELVVLLVFMSPVMVLWSVVILANVGGFRDGLVRRVLRQRSIFSPDAASVLTPERIKVGDEVADLRCHRCLVR